MQTKLNLMKLKPALGVFVAPGQETDRAYILQLPLPARSSLLKGSVHRLEHR